VHGGEQELSMDVNAANDATGIDEQADGFSSFTTAYVEQSEVIFVQLEPNPVLNLGWGHPG